MNMLNALRRWIMMQDTPVSVREEEVFMIGYNHATNDFLLIIQELKKELFALKKDAK